MSEQKSFFLISTLDQTKVEFRSQISELSSFVKEADEQESNEIEVE